MIEEEAVVTWVDAGQIWVEQQRKPGCGSCTRPCVTSAIGDYIGTAAVRLAVSSSFELHPGDRVVVGIREDALIRGAMRVYLLPLVGLFGGALAGKAIGVGLFPTATDVSAAIGGLFGLMGIFGSLKATLNSARNDPQPVVLRKLEACEKQPALESPTP